MTRRSSTSPAREVAAKVLFRVEKNAAWAAPTLDAEIARARLDARDAGLATEIVYGALRVLPALDARLRGSMDRSPRKLDPWLAAALRTGAYQILHLSRVPPHAAVDDAVALVRRDRGARLAGFANAVLRKIALDRPSAPAPPTRMVVPDWLEALFVDSLGEERARAFLEMRTLPPPIGLRVHTERASREEVARAISEAHPNALVLPSPLSDVALAITRAGDPHVLPGYAEGLFSIQELGSQLVGALAGGAPGERVLDACAGRGGKTVQLASRVGDGGKVVAVDVDPRKVEAIAPELDRLHLPRSRVQFEAIDWAVGTGGLEGGFDRIVVDAPCTNLGTLHRRPELLLRVAPADPKRLADLQLQILDRVAPLLRSGGTLVYAVCSPTRAEGAFVADRFEESRPRFRRHTTEGSVPQDSDNGVRIGPWLDVAGAAPDAYQVFRWQLD